MRATRSIPLNPNADFGQKMAAMFRRSLSACLATGPIPRRKPEAARTGSSPSHLYTIAFVAERCLYVASSMSMDGYWISLHSLSSTKAPPIASVVTTHSAWQVRTEWSSCRRAPGALSCHADLARCPPVVGVSLSRKGTSQTASAELEGDTVLAAPCFRWIRLHESSILLPPFQIIDHFKNYMTR